MAKRAKTPAADVPGNHELEQAIHVFRGLRVMVDSGLARLYGATTARLNEQVARNKSRFPDDFAFQLTAAEFESLISQIAAAALDWISCPG